MGLRLPLLAVCVLCLCALPADSSLTPDLTQTRIKRQEPDPVPDEGPEDYIVDYAGNNNKPDDINSDISIAVDYAGNGNVNRDSPMNEPKMDTNNGLNEENFATDTQNDNIDEDKFGTDTQNDNINEDKFGTDTQNDISSEDKFGTDKRNDDMNENEFGRDNFDGSPPGNNKVSVEETEEVKPKKKPKKHKYLKKTLEFLKKVLDPNKLMENAYVTEMLRRFSHADEPEHEERESSEEEEVVHTPKPVAKKRRGRPRKKDKIPPGITGIIKKGVMTLAQFELDKKKLKRRVKFIKNIARKAKKPLKTAVKIFLSSRNQGIGGYGGGGYTNNNY